MDTTTDEQRFTRVYRETYAAVEAYVRRRIHPDRARDVVAEVFLVAWRRFDEAPVADALPWLYGVARRTLANVHRADQRHAGLTQVLAAQPGRDVEDHAGAVADRLHLAEAFDGLSQSDQEVLRLALWEELAPKDAARVLGCTSATFQVRLHRARRRLRRRVASTGEAGTLSRGTRDNMLPERTGGGRDA
ncbi:sigma-70 family RNA polymerase sigma factor [Actinacidiphila glaucinigra]|uniref:RNA polymerase sigma factor n=1 Tax=Actinacidiphila glaucinigra TaxID=235986 RepID=UPI002DDC1FB7|nr:sigma-70 family RNA polymerase sigma factor [Actinacidiphila glaucinigra]WSD63969.1 sigma-70 family RNA polymerase sigma factor [Actinacidiphila glaucinigra]